MFTRPALPHDGTKTRRKDARRSVRNVLGTSSDNAPTLAQALEAADHLKRIIDLASGGRYGLAVVRSTDNAEEGQLAWYRDELTRASQIHEPIQEARRRERELRELHPELRWADYL